MWHEPVRPRLPAGAGRQHRRRRFDPAGRPQQRTHMVAGHRRLRAVRAGVPADAPVRGHGAAVLLFYITPMIRGVF